MQPDQPYSPAPPPSPSGSNIPEYLHMEPIVDPTIAARKKKRLLRIFLIVIVVIAVVAAVAAAVWWVQGEPERKFYRSLDNLMRTSYIDRHISVQDVASGNGYRNTNTVSVDAKSDFSDPLQPRSRYTYQLAQQDEVEGKTTSGRASGEVIVTNAMLKTRYTEYTLPGTDAKQTGKWYEATSDEDRVYYDGSRAAGAINSIFGYTVYGRLTDSTRVALLDFMRSNKIYTIANIRTETKGEKKYAVYSITTNGDKLDKLIAKLKDVQLLDISDTLKDRLDRSVEVWLDDTSGLPVKTIDKLTWTRASATTETMTEYTYPGTSHVTTAS